MAARVRELTPPPTAFVSVFCCRSCGAPLGTCTAEALTVGACVFIATVTLHCVRCGEPRKWRPGR